MIRLCAVFWLAACASPSPTRPQDLPVIEVPASRPGSTLAVLVTGDGGWAAGDRALASTLADSGVPVAAIDSRAYFGHPRTPEETARDWERVARWYMAQWGRDSLLVIGYSRGADVAPFVVNRLSPDLRGRVRQVTMVGLSARASFEFHWVDMVRDVARPTDRPTLPEVQGLGNLPILCVWGDDEQGSLCPRLTSRTVTVARHGGGHQLSAAEGRAVALRVLHALP